MKLQINRRINSSKSISTDLKLIGYVDWPVGVETYNDFILFCPIIKTTYVSIPKYEYSVSGGSLSKYREEGEIRDNLPTKTYNIDYYFCGLKSTINVDGQLSSYTESFEINEKSQTPSFGEVCDKYGLIANEITEIFDVIECSQSEAQFVYRDRKFRLWLKFAVQ